MEKRCYKCGQTKHLIEFDKNRSKKDGHADLCKICKNQLSRGVNGKTSRLLASCRRRAKLSNASLTITKEWVRERLEKGVKRVKRVKR